MPQVTTKSAVTVKRRRVVGRILRLLPHLQSRLPKNHRFLIISSGRTGRRRAPTSEESSEMKEFKVWMNGKLVSQSEAVLPVNSAAVFYASNVFEGIRAYWNEADGEMYCFRLAEHFARFRESMKMMRFTIPYQDLDLYDAVRQVLSGNEAHGDVHQPEAPAAHRRRQRPQVLRQLVAAHERQRHPDSAEVRRQLPERPA